MALSFGALLPHPKSLLNRSADSSELAKTSEAIKNVSETIVEKKISTLIIVSPSAPVPMHAYSSPISDTSTYHILGLDKLQANSVLDAHTSDIFDNDLDLVRQIQERSKPFALQVVISPNAKLDAISSGALRLLDLPDNGRPRLVSVLLPYQEPKDLIEFGGVLGGLAAQQAGPLGILGVGDLSARLAKNSSAGFTEEGKQFDELVTKAAESNDFMPLLKAEPSLLEKAGQEAARPLAVVSSASKSLTSKLASYEVTGGTGYAVLTWT